MIASIGSNTCPILAFSGFAESPGPSASFTYGRRDYWQTLWLSKLLTQPQNLTNGAPDGYNRSASV
jgi:hypothetical protein